MVARASRRWAARSSVSRSSAANSAIRATKRSLVMGALSETSAQAVEFLVGPLQIRRPPRLQAQESHQFGVVHEVKQHLRAHLVSRNEGVRAHPKTLPGRLGCRLCHVRPQTSPLRSAPIGRWYSSAASSIRRLRISTA